jgi:hypothetical protein
MTCNKGTALAYPFSVSIYAHIEYSVTVVNSFAIMIIYAFPLVNRTIVLVGFRATKKSP